MSDVPLSDPPTDSSAILERSDFNDVPGPEVDYYYSDAVSSNVEASVTINGAEFSAKVQLSVVKPSATIQVVEGTTQASTFQVGGSPGVALQLINTTGPTPTDGIRYSGQSEVIPAGFVGKFFFVQLITDRGTLTDFAAGATAGQTHVNATEDAELDTNYPYSGGTDSEVDSPDLKFNYPDYVAGSIDDLFDTFLMFQPSSQGSEPVPISLVVWSMSAASQWNVAAMGWKSVVDPTTPAVVSSALNNFPQWQANAANDQWSPALRGP